DQAGRFLQRLLRLREEVGLVEVEEDVGGEVDAHLRLVLRHGEVLDLAAHVDDLRVQRRGGEQCQQEKRASHRRHFPIGTPSIGWKWGMTTVIFCTSSGGAGKRAQRFTVLPSLMSFTSWLQTHFPSVSRTTRYFFFPASSTRFTPPTELMSPIWWSLSPKA